MAAGLAECVLVPGTLGGAAFEKVFFCASTKLGQRSGLLGADGSGMRRGPLGGTLSLRHDKVPLTGTLLGERIAVNLSLRNDKFFGVEGALSQLALQTVGLM